MSYNRDRRPSRRHIIDTKRWWCVSTLIFNELHRSPEKHISKCIYHKVENYPKIGIKTQGEG
jgi:hypothetical protein